MGRRNASNNAEDPNAPVTFTPDETTREILARRFPQGVAGSRRNRTSFIIEAIQALDEADTKKLGTSSLTFHERVGNAMPLGDFLTGATDTIDLLGLTLSSLQQPEIKAMLVEKIKHGVQANFILMHPNLADENEVLFRVLEQRYSDSNFGDPFQEELDRTYTCLAQIRQELKADKRETGMAVYGITGSIPFSGAAVRDQAVGTCRARLAFYVTNHRPRMSPYIEGGLEDDYGRIFVTMCRRHVLAFSSPTASRVLTAGEIDGALANQP